MNNEEVELTQGVSQMSAYLGVPISDDFLKTMRMTIENLIESSEVGFFH